MPARTHRSDWRPVSLTFPQFLRRSCSVGGEEIHLGPQTVRLLARLLLADPRLYVHLEDMIEWLWPNPDLMPEDPRGLVATRLSQLRRHRIVVENLHSRLAVYAGRQRYGGYRIPAWARGSVQCAANETGGMCRAA